MSKKDNRTHVLMRYFLISLGICLFASAIIIKLFNTTVINADKWNAKANHELSQTVTLHPERGEILAADGNVLATNLRYYTLRLDYRSERFRVDTLLKYLDPLCDSMAAMFPERTAKQWREHFTAPLKLDPKKYPRAHLVARDVSFSDMQRIRTFPYLDIRNRNRSGLTTESRYRRRNPYGSMAKRSIGSISEVELGVHRGISGLEMALDSLLYGVPGVAKKVPLTHNIVNWTDIPPVPGYTIRTTIDIGMQDIVENELNSLLEERNADWGVAVLMEVATGDIKAISNLEKSKTTGKYIEGMNRAVLGFEPGSVVKTLSMLIAVEDGIVKNLDENIPTGGSWAYTGRNPITDSHYTASLKVREVLEHSSNIGMARIITREYDSHPNDYYKRIAKMGFFEPMHTGIAGERIPNFPKEPSRLTLSRVSYGYATEIPPLSTLALYNAIANDGKYVRPRLVKQLHSATVDSVLPVTYIRDSICSRQTARIVRDMLHQVVWGSHGTARRLQNPLVSIAGKTGTCYMVDSGHYNTSKKRLTFCGYFPSEQPLYSCIVLTCNPREGNRGAAATSGTVLENIALKMYSRGMLNNTSDFRLDAEANPKGDLRPTLFATLTPNLHQSLREGLDLGNSPCRFLRSPAATAPGTIPNLLGLGLREAVSTAERNNYAVAINGSGYVSSQTPAPGTRMAPGARITINFSKH